MTNQEFFAAMEKIMEDVDPEKIEDVLNKVEREYFPYYREEKLSKLLCCPKCGKFSKREDFGLEREEETKYIFEEYKRFLITDVTANGKCPKCGSDVCEMLTVPTYSKDKDKVIFCTHCKEEKRLRSCRKEVTYHNYYDGQTYYNSIKYYCTSCGSCVKSINSKRF